MIQLNNPVEAVNWLKNKVTGELRVDSRDIQVGDGFIAWPGATVDARQYVKSALQNGAGACLVEYSGLNTDELANIPKQENIDRKSTRLNSSHLDLSRMPSSA